MLFVTAFVLHQVITIDISQSRRRIMDQVIIVGLVAVSVITCRTNNLTFHSVTFGCMILAIGVKTMALIGKLDDPQKAKLWRLSKIGAGELSLLEWFRHFSNCHEFILVLDLACGFLIKWPAQIYAPYEEK